MALVVPAEVRLLPRQSNPPTIVKETAIREGLFAGAARLGQRDGRLKRDQRTEIPSGRTRISRSTSLHSSTRTRNLDRRRGTSAIHRTIHWRPSDHSLATDGEQRVSTGSSNGQTWCVASGVVFE
ncbi:Uncharacterized protein Fot_30579 [Forsythia ovata]|uniref:Uncharacterized protein n=1 Tax=Forsythia ovata TaxID=205694 RepID=A0ABD1TVL5_9LAMI